jgi:hypothetical protein
MPRPRKKERAMNLEQVLARWARYGMPAGAGEAPQKASSVAGRWTNEYGSTVALEIDGDRIFGSYTSAVGADTPVGGPVTGFVRGDIVAFSVLWPPAMRSITSWVGQVVEVEGVPVLKTLWHLVVDIPDAEEPTGLWTTVHCGADTFR